MAAISNYLENALLNHILRNSAYSSPGTSIYVALYDGDPGDDGLGANELTIVSRQQVTTWDAPADGVTQNSAIITFGPATGAGSVGGVAILDAPSGGNQLFHGLSTAKTLALGDSYQFAAGALEVSLA